MSSISNVIDREPKKQRAFEKWLSQPTDEEIVERACAALATSGYRLLRNLHVHCDNGRVTVQGKLPTYFLKQLAQSIIQRVVGVRDIDNDVRVQAGLPETVVAIAGRTGYLQKHLMEN